MKWISAIAGGLLALSGCASVQVSGPGVWGVDVVEEVTTAVAEFERAEHERDVEAVLAFIGHDFYMYQDGRRVDFEAVSEQIRTTMPQLREFIPRFDGVEVTALAHDAALVSLVFHDVITDADGVTTRLWGPTTFVWRKRDGRWWLVYADSDHYPEPAPSS